MTNQELIEELLTEAQKLKLKDYVLETYENLMEKNPLMTEYEAMKLSLNNAKVHSGFFGK